MKRSIVITYKNGSTINIDVPETFYTLKYRNKPEAKIHKIFMKQYNKFVSASNKGEGVIRVSKYLPFSNATISAESVLGIDIKVIDELAPQVSTVSVPGVHDKTYLDISDTSLDAIFKKLETTNLLENLDTFIKKVNAMMSKNNVEVTIKAGVKKKSTATSVRKKKESSQEAVEMNPILPDPIIPEELIIPTDIPEVIPTTNQAEE